MNRLTQHLKKGSALRRMIGYLKPYRVHLVLTILVIMTQAVINLLPPLLLKYIIDDVLTVRAGADLLVWGVLGLLAVNTLVWVLKVLHEWLVEWMGRRATSDIQTDLYSRLQTLPLSIHNEQRVGTLISRINGDAGGLMSVFSGAAPYFLTNVVMLVVMLAILLSMNVELTLYVLLPAPLVVLSTRVFGYRYQLHRLSIMNSRFSAHVSETLAGLRLVKTCAQEDQEAERFEMHNENAQQSHRAFSRRMGNFFQSSRIVIGLGVFLVWYGGGSAILDPESDMTLGSLLVFLSYITLLYDPLNWFIIFHNHLTGSLTKVSRVFRLMDEIPEPFDRPDAISMPQMEGRVTFRQAAFRYDDRTPVLEDISLDVAPGEMIGLVGKSGVGKSSMVNLICRFYELDQGALTIDGVDIKDIDLRDLRRHIGIVPQESFLFTGTIGDNIRFSKPDASMEEVIPAAVAAHAHEFIVARPNGYDTLIGEQGLRLSGGEKQRIAIARAILKDPRILILDEATSSVDLETEKHIQEAIAHLVKGRTTFAIAHRLSTLRMADRIVVLDGDTIAEVGTHEALMETEGIFHRMVMTQRATASVMAVHGGKDDPERDREVIEV